MASLGAASQVSIDDILEYTSNNEELLPGEQTTQHQGYLPDFVPDTSLQLETDSPAPALAPFQGYQPNTDIYALNKHDLSHRAGKSFVPLAPPSSEMLQNAADPRIAELIPQDHPEWQNLRSGKVTGSSLAEFLGLFEPMAGKALTKAGVHFKMRDHAKLISKVRSLENPKLGLLEVDAQTQIFFDWGHKHEANGILSYLSAYPTRVVHEVGFVLLDPSLQTLSEDIRHGINPSDLPVIGSSPDGIIVETPMPSETSVSQQKVPTGSNTAAWAPLQNPPPYSPHRHWRQSNASYRRVLEIKAKTPFRPDTLPGVWRWLGASCKPYTKILPQYFAQAQLNMLVTNSQSCHLLCYTVKGGSAVFDIPLHKLWCNQMLHWVAQLNIHYVRRGIEPPEDVFWEQDAYRTFVGITKDACQRLDAAGVEVPSLHGSMSYPWFLPPTDTSVPNTPETASADQQLPQQQLQEQLLHQFPPGWQQQQQQQQSAGPPPPWVAGARHPRAQLPPFRQQEDHRKQQQQQQQQQQQFSLAGSPSPAADASTDVEPASLRLLAAAAIPLPDEDITMEDADPCAAVQGKSDRPQGRPQEPQRHPQQPQGHPQQPQRHAKQPQGHRRQLHPSGSGSIGAEGLASWMQHIFLYHSVDLRRLLDASCQRALAQLTAADIQPTLEQVVEDIKRNASAICMNRISCLMPPDKEDTCSGLGPAVNGPGAASHGPGAAWHGLGLAAHGPTGADTSPGIHDQPKFDAMDTAVNVAAADPGPTTGRPPYGPHAHGLGPIAARPALFSPAAMAAAPSPRTCTLGGPPVWRGTPGLAPPSPSLVHAVHNGIQAPAAAATVAQRALWPAADDRRMHLAPNIVQQAGAGADSTGAGPFRPELSRAGVASSGPVTGVGAGSGVLPEHREVSSAFDYFGGQLLPANMASSVKRRLHSVVARHHLYVSPHDFDSAILGRLANMPEHTAMNVLNQAESANWPEVKNNTRVIMSMCTKWANLRA